MAAKKVRTSTKGPGVRPPPHVSRRIMRLQRRKISLLASGMSEDSATIKKIEAAISRMTNRRIVHSTKIVGGLPKEHHVRVTGAKDAKNNLRTRYEVKNSAVRRVK